MPSGYPHSKATRRELFDRVCRGTALFVAAQEMGVSTTRASVWWREAGAMTLRNGRGGHGLARAGDLDRPGGRGHRLGLDERIAIMRGLDARLTYEQIGQQISRDRSVVWREVRRNRNADGDYHAGMAHARAAEKAKRPKAFKLDDRDLCTTIESWMDDGWSPKLIAEVLARDHPDDRLARVSHETIYKCLYVQGRGALRADLNKCLSTKRAARKPRGRTERRTMFSDVITISQRPAGVADRAVPGHWEGDLILGSTESRSAVGTLVERTTGFVMLLHLPEGHGALAVQEAVVAKMATLPEQLRLSLTWDQGKEMANHARIAEATGLDIYFCDPHSPWQRGSNENTNGLLRQYLPKSTDLSFYGPGMLDNIAAELNSRPRKRHSFQTPAEVLTRLLSEATSKHGVA